MRKLIFIFVILCFSILNAFSLKDKIVNGNKGDYVVTEQGGICSVLLIRSLTDHYLILEEIDIPSAQKSDAYTDWKEWIEKEAPGHTAWLTYIINLKTSQLEECYSYSQAVWLPTQTPDQFFPKLLSLSLDKTPHEKRKKIGPPPLSGEVDRRAIWNPSVIVQGKKFDKPSVTAWTARWPSDGSLISNCEIELYFASHVFPVWIEVRSPHYKASLRAIDSGHGMKSPRPLVFQQSPLILSPGVWKKDKLELLVQCPTYYETIRLFAIDLSQEHHPLVEVFSSEPLETSQFTLLIPEKKLIQKLTRGHQYRWVLVSAVYPEVIVYSDHIFEW